MGTIFGILAIVGIVIMFADGLRGCLKFVVGSILISIAANGLFDDNALTIGFLAIIGLAVYQIFFKRKVV